MSFHVSLPNNMLESTPPTTTIFTSTFGIIVITSNGITLLPNSATIGKLISSIIVASPNVSAKLISSIIVATSNKNAVLILHIDYSTDGGITWINLK